MSSRRSTQNKFDIEPRAHVIWFCELGLARTRLLNFGSFFLRLPYPNSDKFSLNLGIKGTFK